MKPVTVSQFNALVAPHIDTFLELCEAAEMSPASVQALLDTPYHRARQLLQKDPKVTEALTGLEFLNILIGKQLLEDGLDDGSLPCGKRKGKDWVLDRLTQQE